MTKPADALTREGLRDAYLLCRTVGHAWHETTASDLAVAERGYWWFVLRCDRCESRRLDLIASTSGDVEGRKYEYPDGYEISEVATRSQLRQEWERRRELFNARRKRHATNPRPRTVSRKAAAL